MAVPRALERAREIGACERVRWALGGRNMAWLGALVHHPASGIHGRWPWLLAASRNRWRRRRDVPLRSRRGYSLIWINKNLAVI